MHVRLTSTMIFLCLLARSTSFKITLSSGQAMAVEGKPYTLTCRISETIGTDIVPWTVNGEVVFNTHNCNVEPANPQLVNTINPTLNCSSLVHNVTILITQQLNRTQWTCERYGQKSQPFTIITKSPTTTSIPIINTVSRSSSMESKTSSTTDHKTTTDVGSSRQGSISTTELVTGLQFNTHSDTKTTMRTEIIPQAIKSPTTTSFPITNTVSRSSPMGSKTSLTTDHKTTTGSSKQGSISTTELVTGLQLNTHSDTKTTMRTETLPQDRINSRKTIIIAVGSSAGVVLVVVVVVVVVCCLKRRKLSAQDGSGLMRQESQNFASSRSSPKGNFRDNSLVMEDNVIYEGASQVGLKSTTRPVDATAMDPRSNQVLSVDDLYAKPQKPLKNDADTSVFYAQVNKVRGRGEITDQTVASTRPEDLYAVPDKPKKI